MLNKFEVIQNEKVFQDNRASRVKIDNDLTRKFLSFDSPASIMGNRLPRLKKTLLQALGDVWGKRVLIYGCGNDSAAVWFSKSGAIVDAIDISPKSVDNQRVIAAELRLNINAKVMDAHILELPSNEYDIVYGNAILHHLDLYQAIPEIVRVLKPEGKAVFRDVMSGNIFLRAFRYVTPFWRTSDEHPLTKNDFRLLSQNFSTCQVSEYVLFGLPYFGFARIMNKIILEKLKVKKRLPINNSIYESFDRLDQFLFNLIPSLKRQAWIVLIILKP